MKRSSVLEPKILSVNEKSLVTLGHMNKAEEFWKVVRSS